jgi:hypothetical protein
LKRAEITSELETEDPVTPKPHVKRTPVPTRRFSSSSEDSEDNGQPSYEKKKRAKKSELKDGKYSKSEMTRLNLTAGDSNH